jgi:hypothetical protein
MVVTRVFGRTLVGVLCKRTPGKKKYVIADQIIAVKADTEFISIDDPNLVVDADGNPVQPSERYWRTATTIDPYHIIVDLL